MKYIELYDKDILDVINLGDSFDSFDESRGDYIKVEILRPDLDVMLHTLYSNKLLFKFPSTDDFYFDEYHIHLDNSDMGFCSGKHHTPQSITNLNPIPIDKAVERIDETTSFTKHFDIFHDDGGNIYIKPNEIIKLTGLQQAKYRLRIYFLRNIKSTLANFLSLYKNNLVENGNFFAGLEATQTGDLDRSKGRNNFIRMDNPGLSNYVLEQDGIGLNQYDMRVTGIEPNSSYIFSCWVAWNSTFDGDSQFVSFTTASTTNTSSGTWGLPRTQNTDFGGSYIGDDNRVISTKVINNITWYKLFAAVITDEGADLGSIRVHLGNTKRTALARWNTSSNVTGRRYYTDLRFVKVKDLFDQDMDAYLNSLTEEETI